MLEKVNEILEFWLGLDKDHPLIKAKIWWKASPQIDQEIKDRFALIHHLATKSELNYWLDQPQSCLAFIILLDQFSRHIYRGTPLAYAQDDLALQACEHGREHKLDKDLTLIQRLFFYMPLMHSEEMNDQKLCLLLMQHLVQEAQQNNQELLHTLEEALEHARRHYDIILNFGRFPQRNAILERESTQEELLYLSLPKNIF